MRQREHQSGFSSVIVLLSVIVVGVIAISGLVLYQHHKSITIITAASNSPQTPSQPNNTTTTQSAQTTTQYLDIKEWGVKLPLSSNIKDAYYVASVSSKGADGLPNSILLGLKSLDGSNGTAAGSNKGQNSAIAAIFRVLPTETDPVTGTPLTQEYPNGVTIGGYYYGYLSLGNSTCKASKTTIQPIDSAFATAAKGIVSDSTITN